VARLMSLVLRVVYTRGCVTLEELLEELERELGRGVSRATIRSYAWQLKRMGKIVSPSRGLYCRPGVGR